MKTSLKPDNSYFENYTDVCFLLDPIKILKILIAVKAPRDLTLFRPSFFYRSKVQGLRVSRTIQASPIKLCTVI